jgi:hypothetical protein
MAKSITRTGAVALADWNKNWQDHKQIATGRVQVLDMTPVKAKEVADLVSTTDGIIFHSWSHDDKVPTGNVIIAQSVGHVNLTEAHESWRAGECRHQIGRKEVSQQLSRWFATVRGGSRPRY